MVCPEFTAAQAREWIAAGTVPELIRAKNVEFVAVRIPFAGGAGLVLNPAAQPAQL